VVRNRPDGFLEEVYVVLFRNGGFELGLFAQNALIWEIKKRPNLGKDCCVNALIWYTNGGR
jgi:hypothetical protein